MIGLKNPLDSEYISRVIVNIKINFNKLIVKKINKKFLIFIHSSLIAWNIYKKSLTNRFIA